MNAYDIIIIGGGVVGCSIARELSRKQIKIAVLERRADVGEGASKANSGIVHAGFDALPGTMKARLNLRGSQLMPTLAAELDFAYKNNGSLVLCFAEEDKPRLVELYERGKKNGVAGLAMLNQTELRAKEPNVNEAALYAMYAPSGAIVCPFELTVAMAENAAKNGVEFYRNMEVTGISNNGDGYNIATNIGDIFQTRLVVNAAGVYADRLHAMVSRAPLAVTPRRGEYLLFDKTVGGLVSHTLFQLPHAYGKGVLVTPTTHGNLLMGPTAEDIADKEGVNTTALGLDFVLAKAADSIVSIPGRAIITSFAGLRAHTEQDDFIIAEADGAPGFIDVAGINSPGLSSAPAIGEYVGELVAKLCPAPAKDNFVAKRQGIKQAPGEVICRCETVTRPQIVEAIHRTHGLFQNAGIVSLDSVKRRVRAGMGRCQAGFCSPRVAEIIASELGVEKTAVCKAGAGSELLEGLL
ncbi:MAG: FAD-dependent oxidoreductase [Lachnospiraceae bacterium]|jgi:glycerol-3-phosphate dehydrogenase|nr:FAD-dependent oxidoreductase [Lachnospiraceae bacterium]